VGDWARYTPTKPSPTGVGSYQGRGNSMPAAHKHPAGQGRRMFTRQDPPVGDHPVGDWARYTPTKPSPTEVGSYQGRGNSMPAAHKHPAGQGRRMFTRHRPPVGAHPVGDWARYTPTKPSPTGVGSYQGRRNCMPAAHKHPEARGRSMFTRHHPPVGAHPVGDWARYTPTKTSPTGVGSYQGRGNSMPAAHKHPEARGRSMFTRHHPPVGAHPVGDWARYTPTKPSPTGVGSYQGKDNSMPAAHKHPAGQGDNMTTRPHPPVGAHPVGDWAWHTPTKPSCTGSIPVSKIVAV